MRGHQQHRRDDGEEQGGQRQVQGPAHGALPFRRRRMRILYLHQFFITRAGVGGTRSYEFARRFVERGHAVRMVTAAPGRRDVDGIDVVGARGGYSDYVSATAHLVPPADARLRALRGRSVARGPARPAAGRGVRHLAAADDRAARPARRGPAPRAARVRGP